MVQTRRSRPSAGAAPVRESSVDHTLDGPSDDRKIVKKRRVAGKLVTRVEERETVEEEVAAEQEEESVKQVVYNDSEDSDSDEDWEDVEITARPATPEETPGESEELTLVFGDSKSKTPVLKRKALTKEERLARLSIHKMHILTLLSHAHLRNHWCNDKSIQTRLKRLLDKKTVRFFRDDETAIPFQRTSKLREGLQQAVQAFKMHFGVSARGMTAPSWVEAENLDALEMPDDLDLPMGKADFGDAARSCSASRDVGAQLFCAMLRACGAEARLVVSLQVLPFAAGVKAPPPKKGSGKKRKMVESSHPVYWTEVFDAASQKWTTIDPLVTQTIGKPAKIEPPASDPRNRMLYVVAFDEHGCARDVTRRYAKAYISKTRVHRVEVSKGGERWWSRVLDVYGGASATDEDQIEDAELARKEAQEPMPANVQDFKKHPHYVLERHLRKNEVLHPRREVTKIAVGRATPAAPAKMESVYRRRHVHQVRSADNWFRLGREVKLGEQPLKYAPAKAEEEPETAMYAAFQTRAYSAPPVVNGRVPRNAFGNLDVYTPSMVPPGGVHIAHPETARACQVLGVDYASAVTGFDFKGRKGTAVIRGAVVASEFYEAVIEVLRGFEYEKEQAVDMQRSILALRMWKRLYAGLQIRKRIQEYASSGDEDADESLDDPDESMDNSLDDHEERALPIGQRSLADLESMVAQKKPPRTAPASGGFVPETTLDAGGFVPGTDDTGGGFVPDTNDTAGGFVPDTGDTAGGFVPNRGFVTNTDQGLVPDAEGGFVVDTASGFVPDTNGGSSSRDNSLDKSLDKSEMPLDSTIGEKRGTHLDTLEEENRMLLDTPGEKGRMLLDSHGPKSGIPLESSSGDSGMLLDTFGGKSGIPLDTLGEKSGMPADTNPKTKSGHELGNKGVLMSGSRAKDGNDLIADGNQQKPNVNLLTNPRSDRGDGFTASFNSSANPPEGGEAAEASKMPSGPGTLAQVKANAAQQSSENQAAQSAQSKSPAPDDESLGDKSPSTDIGSLLSHDPDDEDAVPEWLA